LDLALLKRAFFILFLCLLSLTKLYSQDTTIYRNDVNFELTFSHPLLFTQDLNGIADISLTVPARMPFLKSKHRFFYNFKILNSKKADHLFWAHSIGYGFERPLIRKKNATLIAVLAATYSFWHGNSVFERGPGFCTIIEYHKKFFIISSGYELLGGGNISVDEFPLKLRGSVLKFGIGFHIK
jgi:hypothetical protein